MEPLREEKGRVDSDDVDDNNMVEGATVTATEDEGSNVASLLVVVLSLLFVAIFGYALVGGVMSGDPDDGFFITLIVASVTATVVAGGILARYLYVKRDGNNNNNDLGNKGTFETNDEENPPHDDEYHYPEPVVKEIQAKSVIGEMSALSPSSFGGDSLTTFRHHIIRSHEKQSRQGFDFSRITPAEDRGIGKKREDPPEVGAATFEEVYETRGNSQDPSAPKLSTEGEAIDDHESKPAEENYDLEDRNAPVPLKSPAHSVAKSLPPSILKKNPRHSPRALKRPSTTRSVPVLKRPSSTRSVPANMQAPATPGSVASSFFGMFGKSKKAASETRVSDTGEENVEKETASVKTTESTGKPPMQRPPMLPPSNRKLEDKMKTIGSMPSTPADKSTFTIPPPRPIPRTPMGSEIFSEYQSVVGSTAASSTFDPVAHRRAIEKMQENAAPIGASPAMPVYYNDDEDDDDNASSVALNSMPDSSAYDVFAPPGALGIVVDTTEKGCIVYSLKKSSPMQGLMNKGDLIIGLDNFDVRNMDAAALTKLMAKKAEQAERKFTLMPNTTE